MMIFAYIHEHFFCLAPPISFFPSSGWKSRAAVSQESKFSFSWKDRTGLRRELRGLDRHGKSAGMGTQRRNLNCQPLSIHHPQGCGSGRQQPRLIFLAIPAFPPDAWSCRPFLFLLPFLLCWNHLPWTVPLDSGSPCWVTFALHNLMHERSLQNARASATSSLKFTWLARIQLGTSSSRHL